MFRLLRAGLVAAGRQCCAVVLTTIGMFLLASTSLVEWTSDLDSCADNSYLSVSPLLASFYLLTAIGFALTDNKAVQLTAEAIRHASRRMHLADPKQALIVLIAQLGIPALFFAVYALAPSPEWVVEVTRYFGYSCAGTIGWAGMMSVGVAGFGASAHAVQKALWN